MYESAKAIKNTIFQCVSRSLNSTEKRISLETFAYATRSRYLSNSITQSNTYVLKSLRLKIT